MPLWRKDLLSQGKLKDQFTPQQVIDDLASLDTGKEPANANIQSHVTSQHAPSNAQANADITKAEIEAKLTGEISSHTHAGGGGGQSLVKKNTHQNAVAVSNAYVTIATVPLTVVVGDTITGRIAGRVSNTSG